MFPLQNQSFYIFHEWSTTDPLGLFGALVCTLTLCLVHETLHAFISFNENLNTSRFRIEGCSYPVTFQHCLMAFLHVFRVYVCSLLVMSLFTMNVWVVLTIGLASGVGYLIIRPLVFCLMYKQRPKRFAMVFSKPPPLSSTPNKAGTLTPHMTLSRDLMEALRERRISKSLLSGCNGSTEPSLQWDFTGNIADDLEPNNWIRQSSWDGSLEMLDVGYVGGDSPECSAVSFTI
ncbi:uncharacterized protein LOC144617477 isoform X2 [Crassostrea virginica]